MKKLLNIIPLLLLFHFSQSQHPVKEYLDYYYYKCPKDSAKFYRMVSYDKDTIQHGKVQVYYLSGKIYWEMEYFHGIKCNTWIWWYENGQKTEEGIYDNSDYNIRNAWLPDGTQCVKEGTGFLQSFYRLKDKQPICSGKYINGIQDSLWYFWFDNGNLDESCVFKNGVTTLQEIRDEDGNIMVKNGTGSFVTYHSSGKTHIASKGTLKDGKREGKWTWYHINGKIKQTTEYKGGLLEGANIIYYPTGQKLFEGNYVNDETSGNATWWFWTGQKEEEGSYDDGDYTISNSWTIEGNPLVVNGTGPYESWFHNGKLKCTGYYKNSKRSKNWMWNFRSGQKSEEGSYVDEVYHLENSWNENGTPEVINGNGRFKSHFLSGGAEAEGDFKNGIREGEWKWYYNMGQIKELATYRDGKLNGKNKRWTTEGIISYDADIDHDKGSRKLYLYYDNGKIKEEGIREEDKYSTVNFWTIEGKQIVSNGNGNYIEYFDNGKPEVTGTLKNGSRNGSWKWYHKNGKLRKIVEYKEGLAAGPVKELYENGKISYEGSYKNDTWEGRSTWYDEEGNKTCIANYKKGELDGYKTFVSHGKKTSEEFYKEGKVIYSIVKYYDTGEPLYYILEDLPKPQMGFIEMEKILYEKLKDINEEEITASEDGIIHVNMVLQKNGDIFGPFISKGSFNTSYDEKTLELIKNYVNNWTPGMYNGKPVYTLVHVPVLLRVSDKAKNSFDVSLFQNGKKQNVVNNMMILEKKPFEFKIRFAQPNNNEVEVFATFDSTIYKKAKEGVPMLQIVGSATGMAEANGNPDKDILISSSAPSFWYYSNPKDNRFNTFVISEKEVICNREVDSVMIVNDRANTGLKEDKRKDIPLSMLQQKDLYLIFFTRKNYDSDIYYYDYHRQCLHIRFKD
jgi:antitoxin component YwqK of YwqJK toxin-antitoxin module